MTYDLQGQVVKFTVSDPSSQGEKGEAARRGAIWCFSAAARRRLQVAIRRIDWQAAIDKGECKFATVTYPKCFPSARWSKRDLEALRKALERRFPDINGLWRLEAQRRGAPHYHFLFAGAPWIPVRWLRKTWARIIRFEGPERLQVHVRQVDRIQRLRYYVCKYLAKADDLAPAGPAGGGGAQPFYLTSQPYSAGDRRAWLSPGRFWGYIRRAQVVKCPQFLFSSLSLTSLARVKRLARRKWSRFSPHRYQGGTVFGDAEQWARAIAAAICPPERDPSVHYDYSLPVRARLDLARNWRAIVARRNLEPTGEVT